MLVKRLLKDNLYDRFIDEENFQLNLIDQELLTDMCYQMEEFYFPKGDVVYHKGDLVDGILFIIEGELHIMHGPANRQVLLDKLVTECTYGVLSCFGIFKDEDDVKYPPCEHQLISMDDTVVLKMSFARL